MLKKLLTGGLAAGAIAVPLAGLAWADPMPNPTPPVPGTNAQGPTAPGAPGQPGANPASPASEPTCVVSQNTPVQAPAGSSTSPGGGGWRQVATLQGSMASDLGLPPGQVVKVFCAPGSTQNAPAQPTGFGIPGQQPIGNPGQPGTEPGGPQNPLIPGLPGMPPAPQNPAPGQ